jgi:aminoglycoside phosphotransferase (APT) family kinase protein
VIDFGTARAADPVGDVLPAWWLFEGRSRTEYRAALEIDENTWLRARGWALSLVVIAIPYYLNRRSGTLADGQGSVADILADFG